MISISVIVATYRRNTLLERALRSLSRQTFREFEIIIVDDNADPAWNQCVSDIVESFRHSNPGISVVLVANRTSQGSAESRNVGIRSATGEYITFLDDDDVYLPEKLSSQYHAMLDFGADYSLTDLLLYNENDRLVDRRIRTYLNHADPQKLTALHMIHHMTGTDTFMMRRDYLLKIGMFDQIDIGDEFYLMQKAISDGGVFCYVPGCNVKAYVHTQEEGLSGGEKKIRGENELYSFKKHFFLQFDRKTRRQIRMRHYAVLAYTNLHMHRPLKTLSNAAAAAAASPVGLIRLLWERKV